MLQRQQPLAIYMEKAIRGPAGKMGFGVLRYSANPVACVIDSETAGQRVADLVDIPRDVPIVATVDEAVALGAKVLVLGIAPPGGLIPAAWWPVVDHAVESGLSVVNGLHDLVGPRYPSLPEGQFVWDIRIEPKGLQPGTAQAATLPNRRVLLYGTDMAVGKMTAGLEFLRVSREGGRPAEFVATGQIGITITGAGVPLDAIRVDFASGSIEREVLRAAAEPGEPLVIVEGQGSLIHPGSTANLPLLRGSCPTHMVLCHRAGQTALTYLENIKIPPLPEFVQMYEMLATACGTFPKPKTVGVCVNTAHIKDNAEADAACKAIEDQLGIPAVDPIRHGPARIVDALWA